MKTDIDNINTLKSDRDLLATQLLAEAAERFDIETINECDELYRVIDDVEQFIENGTSADIMVEPSSDPDFAYLPENLERIFGTALLEQASISRITVRPDIVHLNIGNGLYLSREQYQAWVHDNPLVATFKVRAENFTTFQTTGWLTDNFGIDEAPLPIVIYSFEGEDPTNLDYLQGVPPEEIMTLYKFGTVAHEIGHHVFAFVFTEEQRREIINLCQTEEVLTDYAKLYRSEITPGLRHGASTRLYES